MLESFKYSLLLSEFMEDIVVKIPKELGFVRHVPSIDWSILVSKLIKAKLDEIAQLKRELSKSKFTERDADEFSNKINSALAREAFVKRMKQLEILDKLEKDVVNSELTDEDCIKLGRELRQSISEKHNEL